MEELLTFLPELIVSVVDNGDVSLVTAGGQFYTTIETSISNEVALFDVTEPITTTSIGCNHTALLTVTGKLYTRGINTCGQLGTGNRNWQARFVLIRVSAPVKFVATGIDQTALITTEGRLYVCGSNSEGQLGTGDLSGHNTFIRIDLIDPVESVAIGSFHIALVTSKDELYTCGSNANYQLGLSDSKLNFSRFTRVTETIKVSSVATGDHTTIFITTKGQVYGCGYNGYHQLGSVGNRPNTHQVTITMIALPETIRMATLGSGHTALVSTEGRLYTCGYNFYGQLGTNDRINRDGFVLINTPNPVRTVSVKGSFTVVITTDDHLYACGGTRAKQLTRVEVKGF